MAGPRRLLLVVVADNASHLGSAMYFRQKESRVEKLGHSQLEYESSFVVEIASTRPHP